MIDGEQSTEGNVEPAIPNDFNRIGTRFKGPLSFALELAVFSTSIGYTQFRIAGYVDLVPREL
jgi:hypothetical protein